jgi:DNA repair protein RecN (Recombination protein N)
MLTELVIRDLALIESADVELAAGLNAVTGETGAGKSLFVGSLELLRGETPRGGAASWLRRGAEKATVEGRFSVSDAAARERVTGALQEELPELAEEILGAEEGLELVLGRTLGKDGRTRAHVNHRPVALRSLARLAGLVIEIHGQNDHQRLLEPLEQARLFDAFAGLATPLETYRAARARWRSACEALEDVTRRGDERRERLELLRFQCRELEEARLVPGEPAALTEERELLRGASELRVQLGGVQQAFFEDDDALLGRLQTAVQLIERWSERIPRLSAALEALRGAEVHLSDGGRELGAVLDGVEDDPVRLERVEERLDELETLARKYRTDEDGLGEVLTAVRAELAAFEESALSEEELAARVVAAEAELVAAAKELAKRRRAAAPRLEKAIRTSLDGLGLASARFEVALSARPAGPERFGPLGAEDLEFLLAANPGEACLPLRRAASGGEAARIMLALRTVLSAGDGGRTLVFDEIDSGVGGRLGPEVGAALAGLARRHQVLCVTHLPAIAALADRHLAIVKEVEKGRTRTAVAVLEGEARVSEVADMIAGGADEKTARAEARRLLRAGVR